MKDALTIKDLLNLFSVANTLKEIKAIDERADQAGYIYRTVAPIEEKNSIRIDMIKGAADRPVVPSFTDYAATAPRKGRKAVAVGEGRIPATKIGFDITVEDMEQILLGGSLRAQKTALAAVYRDRATAVSAIIAREEYSFLKALQTGKVSLAEPSVGSKRGIKADFDYGVPANRFKTLGQLWSDTATPVIDQLKEETEAFLTQNGFRPQVALASPVVLSNLLKNVQLKKAAFGAPDVDRLLTLQIVNQLFVGAGLPAIIEYNRRADIGTSENASMMDEDKFVMAQGDVTYGPNGPVGTLTRYGTTDRGPTLEAIGDFEGTDYPWPESALSGIYLRTKVKGTGDGSPVGSTIASATTIPNLPLIDRIRVLIVL